MTSLPSIRRRKPGTGLPNIRAEPLLRSDSCQRIQQKLVFKNLRVPKYLIFSEDGLGLKCNLTIQNISGLNLTYAIKSSSLTKFQINSSIGWIFPHSKVSIVIKTRKYWVNEFADIVTEKFVIFVIPIFEEVQMAEHLLEMFWKAFGSDLFPHNIAERHMIETIIFEPEKYSILDLIAMERQRKKDKIEHIFEPADPVTFGIIYEVTKNIWSKNLLMIQNGHINISTEVKFKDWKILNKLKQTIGLFLVGTLLLYGMTAFAIPAFSFTFSYNDAYDMIRLYVGINGSETGSTYFKNLSEINIPSRIHPFNE